MTIEWSDDQVRTVNTCIIYSALKLDPNKAATLNNYYTYCKS